MSVAEVIMICANILLEPSVHGECTTVIISLIKFP